MNKFGKRLVVAGLCLTLSAGMATGCSNNSKTVATLNGEKTSYAVANIMLRYNQAQMQTYYGSYLGDNMWSSYGETIKTSMMSTLKQCLILEKHTDEYEVVLSDDDKTKISDAAKQFIEDNDKDIIDALGATQENVERVLTLYLIQSRMTTAIEAKADITVADEECAQQTIKYAKFDTTTTDEDGNTTAMTDEEKNAVKEKADQLQAAVAGGQDMDEALKTIDESMSTSTESYDVYEQEETEVETETETETETEASTETATEASSEAESETEAAAEDTTTDALADAKAAAVGLKDGEVAADVIETADAYYVVQMQATLDEEATATKKTSLENEKKQTYFDDIYNGWADEADYKENDKLVTSIDFKDTYELWQETETETETETSNETETVAETVAEAETAVETTTETAAE